MLMQKKKKDIEQKESKSDVDENEHESSEIVTDDAEEENKLIRKQWKVGSELEVYSHSHNEWYKGKVSEIYTDDLGEWLVVIYADEGMEKDLERYHKDLRPIQDGVEELGNNIKLGTKYDMLNRMGSRPAVYCSKEQI